MRIAHYLRPLGLLVIGLTLQTFAATSVLAGTSAPGFNLRWDQCYADGGAWNKNFACDTNVGSERLVVSFELAAPMDSVRGIETRMNIAAASPTLPAWWSMKNAGTCRLTSLGLSAFPPAGNTLCPDWSSGQGFGGISSYNISGSFAAINGYQSQVLVTVGVPPSNRANLVPGQEYFAFSITINHAKSVGTGSCAGCQTPVVIYLSSMTLSNMLVSEDQRFGRGANYDGSAYASWQNGYPVNVSFYCVNHFRDLCATYGVRFDCVAYSATRAGGHSWGAIKSLYR
jgi:hypothetical protein